MRYRVNGTIEFNWCKEVEAESADEAEELAADYALDGDGLGLPTGEVEVDEVFPLEPAKARKGGAS